MLFEQEEKKPVDPNVERFRRGEGTFAVVRFRCKADLDKFADIIDQPHLKAAPKFSVSKIKWQANEAERNALSQFFMDDDNE